MLIHAHQSSLSTVMPPARYRYMTASALLLPLLLLLPLQVKRRVVACAAVRVASFHLHATRLSTSDGTRCSAKLRELVQFRSSDCFSCPPPPMSPCPRRPSPDTASTFALAQGQQEGDKRRAQAQAQVPDAAPTPVNHTSRTGQSLHHGLPSALLFWYPLALTSHFHSLQEYGGVCFLYWPLSLGNPEYRDSSPTLAYLSHKGLPLPEVTQSGSYCCYSPG